MSATSKLPGGTASELTRLKRLWLEPGFESSREFWREQFGSALTQPEIRALLKKKLQINLQWNRQLTEFTQWAQRQDALDSEAEAQNQDETEIRRQFGDTWTLDQIREEVLKRSYARAMATGDFAAGRKTIVQDLNVKKVSLDERKLVLLEKKAAQADATDKVLTDAELSPAEREQRIKEIYGRA
ncbi:MAG: hypothetical protein KGL39_46420 [Patescibacteria group bacterium]|nr:hypothetical protein [Patescibacteria group bacterium]